MRKIRYGTRIMAVYVLHVYMNPRAVPCIGDTRKASLLFASFLIPPAVDPAVACLGYIFVETPHIDSASLQRQVARPRSGICSEPSRGTGLGPFSFRCQGWPEAAK